MKKLILFALAAISPLLASAQMTTLTATKIHGGLTGLLANGQLCLTPVNSVGVPTAYSVTGAGQFPSTQMCFTVSAGALVGTVSIPDTTMTTPAIGYTVAIEDGSYNVIGNLTQPIYPSGSTWTLDTWAPTQTVVVPSNVLQSASTAPQGRCTAPSLTTVGAQIYACYNQIWVAVTSNSQTITASGNTSVYATVAGSPTSAAGHAVEFDQFGNIVDAGAPACLVSGCNFTTFPTLPVVPPTGQQPVSYSYLMTQLGGISSTAANALAVANAALPLAGGTLTGGLSVPSITLTDTTQNTNLTFISVGILPAVPSSGIQLAVPNSIPTPYQILLPQNPPTSGYNYIYCPSGTSSHCTWVAAPTASLPPNLVITGAGSPAASQGALDFASGLLSVTSYGANTSTQGDMALIGSSSDGSSKDYYLLCQHSTGVCSAGSPFAAPIINPTQGTHTPVSCATSGTAIVAQPFDGTSYTMVDVQLINCVGAVSFTFPHFFTYTPTAANATNATVSSLSTSAVTITGNSSGTSGFIKFESLQ